MPQPIQGLAHGWEGEAWTRLQLVAGGLGSWDPDLDWRLRRALEAQDVGSPSQFIGFGGAALVAALSAELDRAYVPLAREVLARWAATTCLAHEDDVYLGHPGALLALCEIMDRSSRFAVPPRFLARCYRRTLAAIRRMLDSEEPHYLGFAHGLAGLLFAAECAALQLGCPREPALVARAFDRLADTRVLAPGVGTLWPATSSGELSRMSSAWCHGGAGIALALHGCHLVTGEAAYLELFVEASATVLNVPSRSQTFCCGRAGRAQVLVELFRQTGERRWLDAAQRVADEPAPARLSDEYPAGFSQGSLGLSYLRARLAHPQLPLPGVGFFDYAMS